ncbi:hypothetical protein FHS21_004955 [Phyllobacterium trifolii]|uniref:Uncharacterized protein n=1 Tax=Phyllobacterium trifolii TaxID=300193 RepID=A0A839UDA7_9HYPH|nr:hypothetical protein [Phyllobacterium trifolii]MBB3148507.1 hypothetical protein [Phyllobacterium trifolii]
MKFADDIDGPVWAFENFSGKVVTINSSGVAAFGSFPTPIPVKLEERSIFTS